LAGIAPALVIYLGAKVLTIAFLTVFLYFYLKKVPDMHFIKKPIIMLAFVLLGLPMAGRAQYLFQLDPFFSYFTDKGRYEIGFHYGVLSFGEFAGTIPFGALGAGQGDTNIVHQYGLMNFGGYIGTSIPFKATGHISLFAMDIGLNFNSLTWPGLNMVYSDNEVTAPTPLLNATTMQIGLPIGVEWKVGCDAIETRRLAFSASFGAGILPQLSMTTLADAPDVKTNYGFNCAPYLKAEVGENLWLCTKFRFMATFGDVKLLDVNHALPGKTDGPFRVVSHGNVMLSWIIMPFSPGWRETAWWNTHDTYNQHDRLN